MLSRTVSPLRRPSPSHDEGEVAREGLRHQWRVLLILQILCAKRRHYTKDRSALLVFVFWDSALPPGPRPWRMNIYCETLAGRMGTWHMHGVPGAKGPCGRPAVGDSCPHRGDDAF